MTTATKIIKTKAGLMELAKQLGNVSRLVHGPYKFALHHALSTPHPIYLLQP